MRKRCIALLITACLTATPFNCIAEEASAPKPETIITTKSGAVYTDDTGKSVTGGFSKGTEFEKIGETEDYYIINYKTRDGYIKKEVVEDNHEEDLDTLLKRIEELEKENEELRALGGEDNNTDTEEETEKQLTHEDILQNVAKAYWDMYPRLKVPESYRVVWVKNYENKEILIANMGLNSIYDNATYGGIYVDSYDIETGTTTDLGEESELPSKYDNAEEIDWNEAVEYSKREDSEVETLPDCLVSREEAEILLKNIPEIGETYTDQVTTRLVQEALNAAGFDCGTPDGVAGSRTAAAINAYEEANGLEVNGIITDQLIKTLKIEKSVKDAREKEASKSEYKSDYSYEQLARNPEAYLMNKIKVSGKVLQADVSGDTGWMRLAMNSDYDKVLFITYNKNLIGYRLLEDDYLTIYGLCAETYSYEAVSGATITIPWIEATIIEMN